MTKIHAPRPLSPRRCPCSELYWDWPMTQPEQKERYRRWRLALGDDEDRAGLSERDLRIDRALSAIYGGGGGGGGRGGGGDGRASKGGLGSSAPRVARWLGDVREFFPT